MYDAAWHRACSRTETLASWSPEGARMLRMVVDSQRNPPFEQPFAARPQDVAVLLNANAKQVNAGVCRALSSVLPDEHVYFSRSADGDGTFVAWVNRILEAAERRAARPPRFGVLALGTGNAVAEMVGAEPRRHVQDLARYVRGEIDGVRRLDLLTCDGRRTPFAGVGIDAAVLNDYNWIRTQLEDTPLRRLGRGAPGYGLAVALRSVPRFLSERRATYCEVVNAGRPAWRLDATGSRIGRPIGHGELLYAGPCMLAAASTVPYYGLGLR